MYCTVNYVGWLFCPGIDYNLIQVFNIVYPLQVLFISVPSLVINSGAQSLSALSCGNVGHHSAYTRIECIASLFPVPRMTSPGVIAEQREWLRGANGILKSMWMHCCIIGGDPRNTYW